FSWTPITPRTERTTSNATYYSDVRVPASMLVGEETRVGGLLTTQLITSASCSDRRACGGSLREVYDWSAKRELLDLPDVRRGLGEIHATYRLNELLNWQVAAATGDVDIADASATKVFATERIQRVGRIVDEIVGAHGDPGDPETAALMRWLDVQVKRNVVITFGGGVNEVMRELIAVAGLGLPKVPR
ncbi:acyl-CoA dehydrogenase, partial [Rhodococcus hoagii]|nr:acyl-CoA dehydrogenase [Prescottella equi]